jgi:hypothetical protein
MLILLPLFVAILQLGLSLYVRNTIVACAHEGARYGADANLVAQGTQVAAAQAAARTTQCIDGSLSGDFSRAVAAEPSDVRTPSGADVPVIEVNVSSPVPVIGLFGLGPRVLHVTADALQETP